MLLQPKNTKYRKIQKIRLKKVLKEQAGSISLENRTNHGWYCLRAAEGGYISARQLEAARRVMRFAMKRNGKPWVSIFPDSPVTKKAIGVRMGKGKGNVAFWVCAVKVGQILFELSEVPQHLAYKTIKSGSLKIPLKTKILKRQ
jgi:large subunit ribosomal protein L16